MYKTSRRASRDVTAARLEDRAQRAAAALGLAHAPQSSAAHAAGRDAGDGSTADSDDEDEDGMSDSEDARGANALDSFGIPTSTEELQNLTDADAAAAGRSADDTSSLADAWRLASAKLPALVLLDLGKGETERPALCFGGSRAVAERMQPEDYVTSSTGVSNHQRFQRPNLFVFLGGYGSLLALVLPFLSFLPLFMHQGFDWSPKNG